MKRVLLLGAVVAAILVPAAVLNGDDVFNLVSDERLVFLPRVTVFAPVSGTAADESAKGGFHHLTGRRKTVRAFA